MPSLDIVIPAFNAENCLDSTLEAAFDSEVPAGLSLGCIVVNNRSTDATAEIISSWASRGVTGVDQHDTRGRSGAINAGVAASTADYVLILDADCRLVGNASLAVVHASLRDNIGAGFGYATSLSSDFWGRYHRALAARRMRAGWQGWTTACCVVARDAFNRVGGFATCYEHYGFEDRDFICRLRTQCTDVELRSLPDLLVQHDGDESINDVCNKMYISGLHSSSEFRRNFADEYAHTPYAQVDIDTAPWHLRTLLKFLQPMRNVVRAITDRLVRLPHLPLFVGRPLVQTCSGLFYFRGTVERNRQS